MKPIATAIVGCTGLVGQQFARLLDDHPFFALSCLTASSRSTGKTFAAAMPGIDGSFFSAATRRHVLRETTAAAIRASGARVVFSALPAAVSGPLEAELRARGLCVFSNASSHRLDPAVPLLIPEVNAGHLELSRVQLRQHAGFIVTNPNCVVSGLAIALKPLMAFGLDSVTVTTFQAVSGGGRRGVAAWDILGNVVPFIASEEEKVARETRKLLGRLAGDHVEECRLEVYPACSRVAVKDGHLQSVSLEFSQAVSGKEIAEALTGFTAEPQQLKLPTAPQSPIILHDAADRPQPLLDVNAGGPGRAAGMAVSVGRLRRQGRRFGFFLLVHNTVRGAAGGSVLNAELAVRSGLIPGGEA
ncbi:MAG: aspartate-semialdehyde dehydrogenase [Acidobacteria bacterium]|jgi:aspartate-semialdehyde dehydrogenase|nr:aspartate-semialdehyde dehydrogenase [Acidobacteriota bacterium]